MSGKKSPDLILIAVLAVLAMISGLFGGGIPLLSPIFGLLLVLVLPGYALVTALFPTWPLWGAERLALTVGGSLGVAVVSGFLLNLSPVGIHPSTWSVLLGLVTLGGVAAAQLRRKPDDAAPPGENSFQIPRVPAILLGLSVAVVVVAIVVARMGALAQPTDGFTELWIIPADAQQPQVLQVGVHSQETQPLTYTVRLLLGDAVVQEWPAVALKPGAEWITPIRLPADASAEQPVSVLLYRQDAPQQVYRRVLWWPGAPSPVPAGVTPPPLPAEWPTVVPPPGAPSPTPEIVIPTRTP